MLLNQQVPRNLLNIYDSRWILFEWDNSMSSKCMFVITVSFMKWRWLWHYDFADIEFKVALHGYHILIANPSMHYEKKIILSETMNFSMHIILRLLSLHSINAWENLEQLFKFSRAASEILKTTLMNLTLECEISWKQCMCLSWSESYLWLKSIFILKWALIRLKCFFYKGVILGNFLSYYMGWKNILWKIENVP